MGRLRTPLASLPLPDGKPRPGRADRRSLHFARILQPGFTLMGRARSLCMYITNRKNGLRSPALEVLFSLLIYRVRFFINFSFAVVIGWYHFPGRVRPVTKKT